MGQAALTERPHVVGGQGFGALAEADPRHQLLAVAFVGHADDLYISDRRVGVEEFLDLAWIHVLAAADHHVLDPPDDVDIPVGVHHRDVAGVHPTRDIDRIRRLGRLVPVAEHHRIATGAQFAGPTAGQRQTALGIDHLDLDMGHHPADRRHSALDGVVAPRLGGYGRRLGHAVADRHLVHVHLADDPLHHLDGAR